MAPHDWVHAEGTYTGLTIGLYSTSSYTHNTGVSSTWSRDPDDYLGGSNSENGDNTIGIALDFGNLANGESVTFDYAYVMGDSLENVDIPAVPEPATMLLLGLAGVRRKFKK